MPVALCLRSIKAMGQDIKDALERLYHHAKNFVREYEHNEARLNGQLTSTTIAAITAMIDESEIILTANDQDILGNEFVDKAG